MNKTNTKTGFSRLVFFLGGKGLFGGLKYSQFKWSKKMITSTSDLHGSFMDLIISSSKQMGVSPTHHGFQYLDGG
jgi:hypothetical protein